MHLKSKLALVIALSLSAFLARSSCDDRSPIPEHDQQEIINKVIISKLKHLKYSVNREFHNQEATEFFKFEIPELYKNAVLHSANVTYWDSNEIPIIHASLLMDSGHSFKNEVIEKDLEPFPLDGWDRTGSKVTILSINAHSQLTPTLTLNFGNMCYNHFEMTIRNVEALINKKANGLSY
jgi:hypothetical protein